MHGYMITGLVSMCVFMISHLVAAVWWAGKISGNVDRMSSAIEKLDKVLDNHSKEFYGKEEAKEQIARRDKEVDDIWGAINSIRDEFKKCRIDHAGG